MYSRRVRRQSECVCVCVCVLYVFVRFFFLSARDWLYPYNNLNLIKSSTIISNVKRDSRSYLFVDEAHVTRPLVVSIGRRSERVKLCKGVCV